MTDEAVITIDGLTRRFGDVVAVDNLTLDVYAGEVFGFLGHNGAGKTTAVRLLNGVLAPTAGHARVLGFDPVQEGPALRRRTGVLTETPSLEERLTAYENLTIYAELYDVPAGNVARRAHDMLEIFDLAERADEKVGGYSKGMKQRLALAPGATELSGAPLAGMDSFLENMPSALQAELGTYSEAQQIVILALVYFLAPMYLIVPLMVASVIAADSFAGEKERKTLEALIYTPTSDGELFLGKVLSALLPALAVSWVGFIVYGVVANVAAWPTMGELFFPNAMWVALALWVAPAAAGLGLSTMVLVSARASGFQEAYQIGGAVVIPILLLVIGQATGVMYFSLGLVLLLGLVLWVVDLLLLWFGARTFRRGEMLARL